METSPENPFVLVVDDDAALAKVIAFLIQEAGCRVRCANSGDEALAICAGLPKPPDLVVTEAVMPGMTGMELALRMEDEYNLQRFVFISEQPEKAFGQPRALRHRLLCKPFVRADLIAAVNEALTGKRE